ncbi:hypothetical protein [Methanoregula sp.]|uniref:hypothetical protein n=1 Tax=Methanoregula sp. TaxID=2052170 RepID=UPI0025CF9F6D|nr:hypothetical protein [Methanoregula sp.]
MRRTPPSSSKVEDTPGILILKYMEDKDTIRIQKVNYWSLRLVPPVSIALYFLLFLMLVI